VLLILAWGYLGIAPESIVGLGEGEGRYSIWSRIRKIAIYALPVFILTTIASGFLQKLVVG
jgi:hypothetical protein